MKQYREKGASVAFRNISSIRARKRAFSVNGQFRKAVTDLITTLCSSKTRKIQLNLLNEELFPNPWKVLGFIRASLFDFDVEICTAKLTGEQMQRVFEEWDKVTN